MPTQIPLSPTLNIWHVGYTHTQSIFLNFKRSIQIIYDKGRHWFFKIKFQILGIVKTFQAPPVLNIWHHWLAILYYVCYSPFVFIEAVKSGGGYSHIDMVHVYVPAFWVLFCEIWYSNIINYWMYLSKFL